MRLRLVGIGIAATVAVAALSAWLLELSLERVLVLAPVFVLGAAAVLALAVLWGRVAWESLRRAKHPWRIVAVGAGGVALLVLLTLLGVKLPRE
jgi:hypothetical protein